MHLVVRAWRDWANGVWGRLWVEAEKKGKKEKKTMKTIFRMNGLFSGREQEREREREEVK